MSEGIESIIERIKKDLAERSITVLSTSLEDFHKEKIPLYTAVKKEGKVIYGIADYCFIASKHAIQASMAMKGEGYSSKVAILLPLAEKHFGKEISEIFRKLYTLYIKSEYGMEALTEEEAMASVEYAKKVFKVYTDIGKEVKGNI